MDLDMPLYTKYNAAKVICGMSRRCALTEMKSHGLRASSSTHAPNVAR
jgi:hypothetical protein